LADLNIAAKYELAYSVFLTFCKYWLMQNGAFALSFAVPVGIFHRFLQKTSGRTKSRPNLRHIRMADRIL